MLPRAHTYRWLPLATLLAVLPACSDGPSGPDLKNAESVIIELDHDVIDVGEQTELRTGVQLRSGVIAWDADLHVTFDPPELISFEDGALLAERSGVVTIHAEYGHLSHERTLGIRQVPTVLTLKGEAELTAPVGKTLPVQVQVLNEEHSPMRDAPVTFTAADGTVTKETVMSNEGGIATTEWVLPQAPGDFVAHARVEATELEVDIPVSVQVGPPAHMNIVAGDTQVDVVGSTLPVDLEVQVLDAYENLVQDAEVHWTGSGKPQSKTTPTDPEGRATNTWTLSTVAGPHALEARAGNATAVFRATATPDEVAEIEVLSGDEQTAPVGLPLSDPVVLQARDQYDNAISGLAIEWELVEGGEIEGSSETDADGIVEVTWVLGHSTGVHTATATAGDVSRSVTAEAITGAVKQFIVVEPDTIYGDPGQSINGPILVEARDVFDNLAVDVEVEVSIESGGGEVTEPYKQPAITDEGGRFEVHWLLGPELGTQSIQLEAGAATKVIEAAVTVEEDIRIVSGDEQVASVGTELPDTLVVHVTNDVGQDGVGLEVTWSTEDGSILPIDSVAGEEGEARAVWTLGETPGSKVAEASLTSGQSVGFSADAEVGAVAAVDVIPDEIDLVGDGATEALQVVAYDDHGNEIEDPVANWSSTDETIASVDSEGVVVGHDNGSAQITADVDGVTGIAEVEVSGISGAVEPETVSWPEMATASSGYRFICGIGDDGITRCAGQNTYGALGDGTPETSDNRPSFEPISGGHQFTTIASGSFHTCGIDEGDNMYCWGGNGYGQLGNGETANSSTPVLVGSGTKSWRQVVAGASFTCGLTTQDELYCWGDKRYLADEAYDDSAVPFEQPTPVEIVSAHSWESLSASAIYTPCALTTSGTAYCWGENYEGAAGVSGGGWKWELVEVDTSHSFLGLSGGEYYTCGLTTGQEVMCWGDNWSGTLGDGTTTSRHTPETIDRPGTYVQVNAGPYHGCALEDGGSLFCWGENWYGEAGTNPSPSTSPVPIDGSEPFSRIFLSNNSWAAHHTCGIMPGGTTYCTGDNSGGQFGDGTDEARSSMDVIGEGIRFRVPQ